MELTIYLSCQSRLTHFDPNPLKLNTNPQKKHVVFAVMSNIAPPDIAPLNTSDNLIVIFTQH